MPYNQTEGQKDLLRKLVQEVRAGKLPEEFWVYWLEEVSEGVFLEYKGEHHPPVTEGALDALAASGLILSEPQYRQHGESSRKYTLTGNAFAAVDSDFDAPDTSFVTQLTPLADITNLDDELKERCVLTLQVGGTNPKRSLATKACWLTRLVVSRNSKAIGRFPLAWSGCSATVTLTD